MQPGEFRRILVDELHIRKGDTVIVHSSFGNIYPGFSPRKAITILTELVTDEGNVLMPFYPATNAYLWLLEGHTFDVRKDQSKMGIVSQVFGDVGKKSPHPTKSLAAWGKDRDRLIDEHSLCDYPQGEKSPYFKALYLDAKTVGIGLERNSFFHACEDVYSSRKDRLYADTLFDTTVKYYDREIPCQTYAHDPVKISKTMPPCDFLKTTGCPNYVRYAKNGAVFYTVPHRDVAAHCQAMFAKDIDRLTIARRDG